ncbi:endodeoxyribonuclease [Rhodotorula toruloides]
MAMLFDWPAEGLRHGSQAVADALDFSPSLATCRSLCDVHGPSRTSTAFSVLTEGGNELEASVGEATETLPLEWDEEGEEGTFSDGGEGTGGTVWLGISGTRELEGDLSDMPALEDELSSLEVDPLDLARSSLSSTLDADGRAGVNDRLDPTSQQSAPSQIEDPAGLSTVIESLKRNFDEAFSTPTFEHEYSLSPRTKRFRSMTPVPPADTRAPSPARFELPPPIRPRSPTQAEMDAFFGFVNPVAAPLPVEELPLDATVSALAGTPQEVARDPISPDVGARQVLAVPPEATLEPEHLENIIDSSTEAQKPPIVEGAYYQLAPIPTVSPAGLPLSLEDRRLAIISSLEQLALSVFSQILDNVAPPAMQPADSSQTTTRPPWKQIRVVLAKRGTSKNGGPASRQTIRFPRKYGQGDQVRLGGKELACLLRLVELVLEGLRDKKSSTKRDLYYRDVALFGKQYIVDSLIDDLAATLDVRRSELNVGAAAKGLVAGAIKLVLKDGTVQNGREQSILIPTAQTLDSVEADAAEWVLVIEKEAVFQSLANSSVLDGPDLGNGIILTGKGYPDIATRDLLKLLSDSYPSLPLFALVDSDPHGLDILSTYRFGSAALSHDSANLAVPRLEWLGVKGTEWDSLGVDRDELLSLSLHDRRKALAMLKREGLPDDWRRELQYMLHLGRKAEIQILASSTSPPQHDLDTQIQLCTSDPTPAPTPSRLLDYIKTKLRLALARMEGTEHA